MQSLIVLALLAAIGAEPEPARGPGQRLEFTVKPAAAGRQVVRVSLPFPPGVLPAGDDLAVSDGDHEIAAAVRVLTRPPGGEEGPPSARRALAACPHSFADREPVSFRARATPGGAAPGGRLP